MSDQTIEVTVDAPQPSQVVDAQQESVQAAAPAPDDELLNEVREMRALLEGLSTRLDRVSDATDAAAKQVSFLPPQVRTLAAKVDRAAAAVGEARYQSLLLRVLGVYDLVCQMQSVLPEGEGKREWNNYAVLRAQILQLLTANGLAEIPTSGKFDPELHQAVERVPCSAPELDGQVLEVLRPGFRTDLSVLRFAEVRVGAYIAPKEENLQADDAQKS